MTARQIAVTTVLCLSYLVTGNICPAQTFHGDFLGGMASGTFDTWGIAAGDFNGDGKVDIATVSLNENTLNVFLGNGDGTFTGGFTYTFIGEPNSPMSLITADVNGDGKPDLICHLLQLPKRHRGRDCQRISWQWGRHLLPQCGLRGQESSYLCNCDRLYRRWKSRFGGNRK